MGGDQPYSYLLILAGIFVAWVIIKTEIWRDWIVWFNRPSGKSPRDHVEIWGMIAFLVIAAACAFKGANELDWRYAAPGFAALLLMIFGDRLLFRRSRSNE